MQHLLVSSHSPQVVRNLLNARSLIVCRDLYGVIVSVDNGILGGLVGLLLILVMLLANLEKQIVLL